jgi:hypothetical protein
MTGWTLVLAFTVAAVAAVRGLWSPCGLSMVSALNPMSERARGHRYVLTALWYVAGAVAGGAVLGAGCALGALAVRRLPLTATATALAVLGCALVAFVSDVPVLSWRLPGHPRQVNEQWIGRYRRWVYAAGFGAQIGTGFATYIMTAAVYLTAALAALTGRPGAAFAVGLSFGLVRGLGVLACAAARTPDALRALHQRLDRWAAPSLGGCLAAEGGVVTVAAWLLAGPVASAGIAAAFLVASGWPLVTRRVQHS